jgi:methanogenic corrinoid protein MtbC1
VKTLAEEALAAGSTAEAILENGLLPGMEIIGERFRRHQIFLPQVLLAARARPRDEAGAN